MKYVPQAVPKRRSTVSSSGKKVAKKVVSDEKKIDALWGTWCSVTKRPDDKSVLTDDVRARIVDNSKELLKNPVELVKYTARSAAYIPPMKNDPEDVQRLIKCCYDVNVRKSAINAMNLLSSHVFYWVDYEDLNSVMNAIIEKIRCKPYDELPDKEQTALVTLANMPSADVRVLIDSALIEYEESDSVKPSEIITLGQRKHKQAVPRSETTKGRNRYSKKGSGSVYAEGRKEDNDLFGDGTLEYDVYAMQLMIEGCSREKIMAYHNNMPKGYWSEVAQIIEESEEDLEPMDVYQSLYDKYKVHPEERNVPNIL